MIFNADFIYPVGSLYITTSTVSPQVYFGGTWEKITGDAYLKIVQNDTNLGQYGGTSSQHKIPIESMPAHKHSSSRNFGYDSGTSGWGALFQTYSSGYVYASSNLSNFMQNAGGGQAYYPYYYGVYVWRRTA